MPDKILEKDYLLKIYEVDRLQKEILSLSDFQNYLKKMGTEKDMLSVLLGGSQEAGRFVSASEEYLEKANSIRKTLDEKFENEYLKVVFSSEYAKIHDEIQNIVYNFEVCIFRLYQSYLIQSAIIKRFENFNIPVEINYAHEVDSAFTTTITYLQGKLKKIRGIADEAHIPQQEGENETNGEKIVEENGDASLQP